MKKVDFIDVSRESNVKFEDKQWGFVNPSRIYDKRNAIMATEVIPSMLRPLPTQVFEGEMEVMFLKPLMAAAEEFLANGSTDLVEQLSFIARKYSLISEVLSITGSKIGGETVGLEMLKASATWSYGSAITHSSSTDPKTNIAAYLNAILGATPKDIAGDFAAGKIRIPGLTALATPKSPEEQTEVLARAAEFYAYAGLGRGPNLMMRYKMEALNKLLRLAWTARAMHDRNLLSVSSGKAPITTINSMDAFAFMLALASYLYHSRSAESYDLLFRPQPDLSDTKSRVIRAISSVKKGCWFYTTIGMAAHVSDLYVSLRLTENTISFLENLLPIKSPDMKHALEKLALARSVLLSVANVPIVRQIDSIFSDLQATMGVDALLPMFVKDTILTGISVPSMGILKDSPITACHVTIGKVIHDDLRSVVSNQWLNPLSIAQFEGFISSMAEGLKIASDTLQLQANSYFITPGGVYDPNELGLPPDLLIRPQAVIPVNKLVYTNPKVREFLPLSIPRYTYKYETSNVGEWRLTPLMYGVVNSAKLRKWVRVAENKDKIRPDCRFVFDRCEQAPLVSTLPSQYLRHLIPAPYVRYSWYHNMANAWEDVLNAYKAASEFKWLYPDPFQDLAYRLVHGGWAAAQACSSLSAICQVFIKEKDNSWRRLFWTESDTISRRAAYPPTIYGMPVAIFMTRNSNETKAKGRNKISSFADFTTEELDNVETQLTPFLAAGGFKAGGAGAEDYAYRFKLHHVSKDVYPSAVEGYMPDTLTSAASAGSIKIMFCLHNYVPVPEASVDLPFSPVPGGFITAALCQTAISEISQAMGVSIDTPAKIVQSARFITDYLDYCYYSPTGASDVEKRTEFYDSAFIPNSGWATMWADLPHLFFSTQPTALKMGFDEADIDLLALRIQRSTSTDQGLSLVRSTVEVGAFLLEGPDIFEIAEAERKQIAEEAVISTADTNMKVSSPDNGPIITPGDNLDLTHPEKEVASSEGEVTRGGSLSKLDIPTGPSDSLNPADLVSTDTQGSAYSKHSEPSEQKFKTHVKPDEMKEATMDPHLKGLPDVPSASASNVKVAGIGVGEAEEETGESGSTITEPDSDPVRKKRDKKQPNK